MYVVREIMYCKPGKVRALVDKFLAMSALGERAGMSRMRVMTDFAAERYWTVVAEMEVPNLETLEKMLPGGSAARDAAQKEIETIMTGYHDLVDHGKREIYKVEAPSS